MLEKLLKNIVLEKDVFIDERFSKDIKLYDYQIEALKNTDKFLSILFEDEKINKKRVYELYKDKLENDIFLEDTKIGDSYFSELFLGKKQEKIEFKELVNRCSFWMATGSGKTLVMIKLIELLQNFPKKNILILAPTDEIINQIKKHIDIYNSYHTSNKIEIYDLRDFDDRYNNRVYIYRSNNIVDSETKEKQLNFMEFFNNGEWYLILDEAHKGDSSKDISKRKALFNLISKNGVIFNFSATFSDELDIVTTIFDFKLDRFLQAGYGKKIMLLDSSVSVKEENQLDNIAKSLILLSQLRKDYEKIKKLGNYYHSPLMMTIANKVNTESADLKIFFEKLALIAKGEFDFEILKNELNSEIKKEYMFNLGKLNKNIDVSKEEFYNFVFNSSNPANIEYAYSNNKNELVFKLKNSQKYFMLIYAGEIIKWDKEFLSEYDATKSIDNNYFNQLNENSDISILLGSRMFIEGWDTNRVNIINFVELGKSDAQKLILQAIGRGVRIEVVKNKRKRLVELDENDKREIKDYKKLVKLNELIESLFIFPSKKEYIEKILTELKKVSNKECKNFSWIEKQENKEDFVCVPVYEDSDKFNDKPFYVNEKSVKELKSYIESLDDKILIFKHNISTRTLKMIKNNKFKNSSRKIEKIELLKILDSFWNEKVKKLKEIKILTDEIIHYQKMCAILEDEDLKELEKDLKEIKDRAKCPDDEEKVQKLKNALEVNKELGIDTYKIEEELKELKSSKFFPKLLECKIIKEHFYIPILYKENSQIFMHIIKNESEIKFLQDLENYLKKEKNKLKLFDKWMFSKIEEKVDDIKIPYFDTKESHYKYFYPDFVFWLKKGNKKYIIFIDPKGVEHTLNARDKIIGFLNLKNEIKNKNIEIRLFYYNENEVDSEYKEFWCSDFDKIFHY